MLKIDEGKKAINLARETIEKFVTLNELPTPHLSGIFKENQGVFVTLHTHPEKNLRGCIGMPLPVMPLQEAIIESAKSATRDPRFPPLTSEEINRILVEVTILTKPEKIIVEDPKQYPSKIEIGKDGLIIEQSYFKGLLLPQVPVEQKWDEKEFLSHCCLKAGLLPDAWLDRNTKISKFSGQIFSEIKPKGEVKEISLNGSDH